MRPGMVPGLLAKAGAGDTPQGYRFLQLGAVNVGLQTFQLPPADLPLAPLYLDRPGPACRRLGYGIYLHLAVGGTIGLNTNHCRQLERFLLQAQPLPRHLLAGELAQEFAHAGLPSTGSGHRLGDAQFAGCSLEAGVEPGDQVGEVHAAGPGAHLKPLGGVGDPVAQDRVPEGITTVF